jgi:hypothetical protein
MGSTPELSFISIMDVLFGEGLRRIGVTQDPRAAKSIISIMVDDLPLLKLSLVDPSKGNQNDE